MLSTQLMPLIAGGREFRHTALATSVPDETYGPVQT